MVQEVQLGANVLIWFSITLISDNGVPAISGGPNRSCVTSVQARLDSLGFDDVAHLISIGGWDAAHPNTSIASGTEWWSVFETWNQGSFDGIDWDLEGNDNLQSPYNTLQVSTLQLIEKMSDAAKRAGAIVTLVPPQSYFDTTETSFETSLTLTYADWQPNFTYRGRNAYAPLVAWNSTLYDLIDVQLYESWSRTSQTLEEYEADPADYLFDLVVNLTTSYTVNFGEYPQLGLGDGSHNLSLPADKLILGFSRGSASQPGKSPFIAPQDVNRAYRRLGALQPRGCMLWNANLDGGTCWLNNGSVMPACNFVATWNSYLNIRP